jgi:hypothetical protein
VAAPALTHAEFLATLVAEGYLPIAQGKLPTRMPIEALPLTEEEKKRAGATPGSLVVFYPVGDTGVFLQLGNSRAVVWYEGVNCDGALATLERTLQRAHPAVTFVGGAPLPESTDVNVRLYRLELDEKRAVELEVMYPSSSAVHQRFVVHLAAWEKT